MKRGSKEDVTNLEEITLSEMPKLKNICSVDPQGILSFHNLENVSLVNCGSIEYPFSLSVASCCSHLEILSLTLCGSMKEIVSEKKGSACVPLIFEFDQLNTLFGVFLNLSLVIEFWVNLKFFTLMMILSCWVVDFELEMKMKIRRMN